MKKKKRLQRCVCVCVCDVRAYVHQNYVLRSVKCVQMRKRPNDDEMKERMNMPNNSHSKSSNSQLPPRMGHM